jgi:DNA-binding CsgD family transcriptional regulator
MTDVDTEVPDSSNQHGPFRQYRQGMAALALRLAGASYMEVAEALGLSGIADARELIESTLANKVTAQDREHLRREEAARLDRLQRGVWTKALDQNHPEHLAAVKVVLQISESRRRLLGLDAPTEISVHTPTQDEIERWVSTVSAQSVADYTVLEANVVELPALAQ